MTHRTKFYLPAIVAILSLAILLILTRSGRHDHEIQIGADDMPHVTGAWFVQYLSDPNPYLDIEIAGMDASQILSVRADLTGPRRTFSDIELSYNPADGEWQKICDFLPPKLPGGLWWISRIVAVGKNGSQCVYVSDSPQGQYSDNCLNSDGAEHSETEIQLRIGTFYASGEGESIYRITTFPIEGEATIDPIMYVYKADNPKRWFALSDDPDVKEIYPKVALPLSSGEEYLIQVFSLRGDVGSYGIYISDSDFVIPTITKSSSPDSFEPDNSHQQANPIYLHEAQSRTLSPFDDASEDVDWIRFTAPAAGASHDE